MINDCLCTQILINQIAADLNMLAKKGKKTIEKLISKMKEYEIIQPLGNIKK